jgi:hypothetical protein
VWPLGGGRAGTTVYGLHGSRPFTEGRDQGPRLVLAHRPGADYPVSVAVSGSSCLALISQIPYVSRVVASMAISSSCAMARMVPVSV